MRSCTGRQVGGAFGELAGVAADSERDGLDRIDADPPLDVDRVGAARQRLIARAIDRRHSVTHEAVGERSAGMHAPIGGGAKLGAVNERVLDKAVAIDAFNKGYPRKV